MYNNPEEKPSNETPPSEDPVVDELPPMMEPQDIKEGSVPQKPSSDANPTERRAG